MAVFADVRGLQVRWTFARGICAVVASRSFARDIDVFEVGGQPGGGRVSVVAGIATGDVGRVFAGGRDAIMTGTAGAQNLRVVDRQYGSPDVRAMAIFADIGRLNVRGTFAGCFDTVVAAGAVAGDTAVIKGCWQPAGRRVTVVAGIAAGNVRRVFARGRDAVLTGDAGADDMRVIYVKLWRKHIGRMTVIADVRGVQVRWTVARRI